MAIISSRSEDVTAHIVETSRRIKVSSDCIAARPCLQNQKRPKMRKKSEWEQTGIERQIEGQGARCFSEVKMTGWLVIMIKCITYIPKRCGNCALQQMSTSAT